MTAEGAVEPVASRSPASAVAASGQPPDLALRDMDRLLLVASHFTWPKLFVAQYMDPSRSRRTVLLRYTLAAMEHEARAPQPPEDLLDLLRAAGDPTRLQIIQLLAGGPRSTRELARLIGLTEAAISKHLKPLRDAGWVWTERQSYYVYNHLDREAAARLGQEFDRLWRTPPETVTPRSCPFAVALLDWLTARDLALTPPAKATSMHG